MAVVFPANPAIGTSVTDPSTGATWMWDGSKWTVVAGSGGGGGGGGGGSGTVTSVGTGTGLTGGPITSSGVISLADTAVVPGSYTSTNLTVDAQGRLTAASNGTGGGGGGALSSPLTGWTPQFDWPQQYTDPQNYTTRVIAPGFNSGLTIASGAYPPGYRVANGTNGGALASGTSNGTLPIRLQPPTQGVGTLKFAIVYKMAVINNSNNAGSFYCVLGTTASSGPNTPLFPYLGVGHDNASLTPITIQPGETMEVNLGRMDVVDNALLSVPGWPNWTMTIDPAGNLLFPAVCPIFANTGTVPLTVTDIFSFGVVC